MKRVTGIGGMGKLGGVIDPEGHKVEPREPPAGR